MLKLGFTATQLGLTEKQLKSVRLTLESHSRVNGSVELHHGECVGGDEDCHWAALHVNLDEMRRRQTYERAVTVILHPPIKDAKRGWCPQADGSRERKDYIPRNHDIVDETSALLAAPRGPEKDYPRSGTWATVRYARTLGRPIMIAWPDGDVTMDGTETKSHHTDDFKAGLAVAAGVRKK